MTCIKSRQVIMQIFMKRNAFLHVFFLICMILQSISDTMYAACRELCIATTNFCNLCKCLINHKKKLLLQ